MNIEFEIHCSTITFSDFPFMHFNIEMLKTFPGVYVILALRVIKYKKIVIFLGALLNCNLYYIKFVVPVNDFL